MASVLGHCLPFTFLEIKTDILSRERTTKAMLSLYGCLKNTFIFDVRTCIHDAVHEDMSFIFILVKLDLKKVQFHIHSTHL